MTKRNIPYNKLTFILSVIGFIGSLGFYIGVLRQVYAQPKSTEIELIRQENHQLKMQVDTLTKKVDECKRKKMKQASINKEVKTLLDKKQNAFTAEELKLLKQYEPSDGQNKLYSFFTPLWLCDVMVKLAIRHGFNPSKGKVLEPSAGTGNFIEALIDNGVKQTNIRAFELDKVNHLIAKARTPNVIIHNDYFETYFLTPPRYTSTWNNKGGKPTWSKLYPFDLVIGNPPYGIHKNRYSSYFKRPKFRQTEQFFMYKSLEVLKKDGLLVFITGSNFLRNESTYLKEKSEIGKLAELVDAYRMPKVFKNTQAPTDILIFKRCAKRA
jgi:type I restriction-modification system DNA methylase subunit